MECNSSFAKRLKELRTERGLSHVKLAKQVGGISSTAVGFWEIEKTVPNLDAVKRLAHFFGVTVGYMAGDEDESGSPGRI